MKYAGFYLTVFKYLTKTRGWSKERADRWLLEKSFDVVCRTNNRIVRLLVIARHNYAERRDDGSVWVRDTTRCSATVCLSRAA